MCCLIIVLLSTMLLQAPQPLLSRGSPNDMQAMQCDSKMSCAYDSSTRQLINTVEAAEFLYKLHTFLIKSNESLVQECFDKSPVPNDLLVDIPRYSSFIHRSDIQQQAKLQEEMRKRIDPQDAFLIQMDSYSFGMLSVATQLLTDKPLGEGSDCKVVQVFEKTNTYIAYIAKLLQSHLPTPTDYDGYIKLILFRVMNFQEVQEAIAIQFDKKRIQKLRANAFVAIRSATLTQVIKPVKAAHDKPLQLELCKKDTMQVTQKVRHEVAAQQLTPEKTKRQFTFNYLIACLDRPWNQDQFLRSLNPFIKEIPEEYARPFWECRIMSEEFFERQEDLLGVIKCKPIASAILYIMAGKRIGISYYELRNKIGHIDKLMTKKWNDQEYWKDKKDKESEKDKVTCFWEKKDTSTLRSILDSIILYDEHNVQKMNPLVAESQMNYVHETQTDNTPIFSDNISCMLTPPRAKRSTRLHSSEPTTSPEKPNPRLRSRPTFIRPLTFSSLDVQDTNRDLQKKQTTDLEKMSQQNEIQKKRIPKKIPTQIEQIMTKIIEKVVYKVHKTLYYEFICDKIENFLQTDKIGSIIINKLIESLNVTICLTLFKHILDLTQIISKLLHDFVHVIDNNYMRIIYMSEVMSFIGYQLYNVSISHILSHASNVHIRNISDILKYIILVDIDYDISLYTYNLSHFHHMYNITMYEIFYIMTACLICIAFSNMIVLMANYIQLNRRNFNLFL